MRHLTSAICLGFASLAAAQATSPDELMQSIQNEAANSALQMLDSNIALSDSIAADSIPSDSLVFPPVVIRELPEILASLPDTMPELPFNPLLVPWLFSGYRSQRDHSFSD